MRDLPILHPLARAGAERALREHAQMKHAPYPQYDGYYDDWTLHVVTDHVAFKGGTAFRPGEIVLASPSLSIDPGIPVTRTAYDPNTGHNCAVPHESIRPLPSPLEDELVRRMNNALEGL